MFELVEDEIKEEDLLGALPFFSKSCYEELNTERSLADVCGYPLCSKSLLKNAIKQNFKIDLRNKRVYDLAERKLFCSNVCFKSSCFLKEQLCDEPLWLRDSEEQEKSKDDTVPPPKRKTLISFYTDSKGLPGTKVNLLENIDHSIQDEEARGNLEALKADLLKEKVSLPYMKDKHVEELQKSMTRLHIKEHVKTIKDEMQEDMSSAVTQIRKSEPKKTITVEETLLEWVTLDTLLFIYGREAYQLMQVHTLKPFQELQAEDLETQQRELEESIARICLKLDEEERLEEQYIREAKKSFLSSSKENKRNDEVNQSPPTLSPPHESNPSSTSIGTSRAATAQLPNKAANPSESKKSVTFTLPDVFDKDVNEKLGKGIELKEKEISASTLHDVSQLPLISSKSQNTLRRRIVNEKVGKSLSKLVACNDIAALEGPMHELISTFHLTATNIAQNADSWTLIALFLLRFLIKKKQNCVVDGITGMTSLDGIYKNDKERSSVIVQLEEKHFPSSVWEDKVERILAAKLPEAASL